MSTTTKEMWLICNEKEPLSAINVYPTKEDAEKAMPKYEEKYGPGLHVIEFEEFENRREARLVDRVLKEIDEEAYFEALEVLPPMNWHKKDGVERFLMSEFYSGNYTNQYAQRNGRYFTRMVNAFKRETWITAEEIDNFIASK